MIAECVSLAVKGEVLTIRLAEESLYRSLHIIIGKTRSSRWGCRLPRSLLLIGAPPFHFERAAGNGNERVWENAKSRARIPFGNLISF